MSAGAFDGSEYRRAVLTPLRERNPSEVDDLFWLAHVPRELEDGAAIATRLRETKGFLNKERSRARQAAIASAVLKEWPRVEGVLNDAAARRALRDRLKAAPQQATPEAGTGRRRTADAGADPAARRRRQVTKNLNELARLRDEPELADDLFAFLGLPVTATKAMITERVAKVGEVNRRRRPDRERTLVDELLEQVRELLVQGDPAAYLAGSTDATRDGVVDALLAGDATGAQQALARARAGGIADADVLAGLAAGQAGPGSADVVPVSATGLGTWCPTCTTVSSPGAHICAGCGAALTMACTNCRTPVAVDLVSCSSCGASLRAARAPLLARREQQREQLAALARVQAAPEAERPALLARLAAQHPEWEEVRRRAASAPPRAPAQVTVILADGEARLTWPPSEEPGVDYLVERVQAGSSRVLGRTAVTTWTDAQKGEGETTWQVRALRGEQASPPAVASVAGGAPPVVHGALADVQAVAGVPVLLSWRAPPGADIVLVRVERRPDGDIERRLYVDPDGYRDRQVARGRRYDYRVSIEGAADPPVVLEVEAGSGETVRAGSGAAARPSQGAQSPPPPAPPPPPAHGALIVGVSAARDADGRLRVTWEWPSGITEAWVAFDERPPSEAGAKGRKVTNMRYELDSGALIDGVPAGAHVAVFAGKRDPAGTLTWGAAADRSRTVAP